MKNALMSILFIAGTLVTLLGTAVALIIIDSRG